MKIVNKSHIEGYVYQHTLELKTSGPNSANPGTQYISGNLDNIKKLSQYITLFNTTRR